MTTRDGVRVTRTATPFDPAELGRIAALADERRGGVMCSGMEYPGRYSRWHMAYADPCAEIVATGRRVTARALNDRGRVLLPVLSTALHRAAQHQAAPGRAGAEDAVLRTGEPVDEDTVFIAEDDREFTEEERSRRPTVFTALREIIAAFSCGDPHLGLYGAFGYDLAFQFEPARLPARPGAAPAGRDLGPRPQARGGGQVLLRLRGGRSVHGRARPRDGAH